MALSRSLQYDTSNTIYKNNTEHSSISGSKCNNQLYGKDIKQIRQSSVLQWMDDHITITTKVEEILDVDTSQISSVLNLVFDADIA